jgi:MinD-like ATPase involved in chromosome partitioning or flagellar assembly
MSNDTPQASGEGASHDAVSDPEQHDSAGDAARAGAEVRADPNGWAELDEAAGAANEAAADVPSVPDPYSFAYSQGSGPFWEPDRLASPAVNRWAGWEERAEPDHGADGYSWPSSYHQGAEQPEQLGYRQAPDYPRGPGFAPIPRDHPDPGYPVGTGNTPDSGHAPDVGYPQESADGTASGSTQDPGYARDPGHPGDPGYVRDAGYARDAGHTRDAGYASDAAAVPLMEPLPAAPEVARPVRPGRAGHWMQRGRTAQPGQAPPAMMPPGGRVPGQQMAPDPMPEAFADPDYERETCDSLTSESLLHGKRTASGSGWRRSVHRLTGGLLRFGESAADMRRRDLINRVRTPVAGGHHRVAVLSLKGGVGKTTTTVGLGATLATLRGDRVIAVDANPDRGTLSDKVRLETAATIRDLLNERDQLRRYADVRAFTSQAPSRLEILASDRDPGVSVAFGADDYCDAARVLEHFYSVCLTDCGTGLLHSAISGVLQLADQIVVVSSPSVDGARSASATLDWLEAHNRGDLVRNGVVALSAIRPKSKSTVDLDRLEHHFASRCRAVARIPYDPHLEEGAEVELELLGAETADAYLTLAAIVGDGLAWPRRLTYSSAFP